MNRPTLNNSYGHLSSVVLYKKMCPLKVVVYSLENLTLIRVEHASGYLLSSLLMVLNINLGSVFTVLFFFASLIFLVISQIQYLHLLVNTFQIKKSR